MISVVYVMLFGFVCFLLVFFSQQEVDNLLLGVFVLFDSNPDIFSWLFYDAQSSYNYCDFR